MNGRDISDTERVDWLRLIRTDNVGPVAFQRLLQRFGTVAAALAALPDLKRSGGAKRPANPVSITQAEDEIAKTEALGGRILTLPEPDYPALLREISDPPPVISVLGRIDLFRENCIAVVGARNASSNGMRLARTLAHELSNRGMIITSGLARGIDTAAHHGAGAGSTIAVLAGGIDNIYPRENTDLYAAIRDSGCIVSEMPLGTQPQARHFPRRNRIVSGLSQGTLVIEATLRSGSLITARLANEQGREVMAVPGFPSDARASGPNSLIKNGAMLVESAEDVIDALQFAPQQPSLPGFEETTASSPSHLGSEPSVPPPSCLSRDPIISELAPNLTQTQKQNRIREILGAAPVHIDTLLRDCQLSAAEGAVILLELELAGEIERQPGEMISLRT